MKISSFIVEGFTLSWIIPHKNTHINFRNSITINVLLDLESHIPP